MSIRAVRYSGGSVAHKRAVGETSLFRARQHLAARLAKSALEASRGASSAEARSDAGPGPTPAPAVTLCWQSSSRWLTRVVADRGSGLQGDVGPCLPFVTSKPHRSGIGLALCREVADAHGGRLELTNRSDEPGCVARLTLPLGN